jgi:hypothetical protein
MQFFFSLKAMDEIIILGIDISTVSLIQLIDIILHNVEDMFELSVISFIYFKVNFLIIITLPKKKTTSKIICLVISSILFK